MKIWEWYEKVGYRKLMIIPVIILLICVSILVVQHQVTGEFIKKGMDFKGGSQLSVDVDNNINVKDLESFLRSRFGDVEVSSAISATGRTLLIRCEENVDEDELLESLKDYGLETKSYSFQKIGASLGESFFSQSVVGITFALIFMGIVVFVVFKNFIPSLAVIFAALADMIGALSIMQVLGMELSLASFAGLLMVIGYSIDTDILLTTRVLKRREGSLRERIHKSLKTGLTMTFTTLAALIALYLGSGVRIFHEIAIVLIISLLLDIPNTYLMNLGILRWWMERKGIK